MVIIDHGKRNHGAGKEAGGKEEKAEFIFRVEEKKTCRCQDFDKKGGERNFCAAVAAGPFEENKGEDWDVVIEFDPCFTFRAAGWRFAEIYIPGESENDHVEKAAPGEAE